MNTVIEQHVKECHTCQETKSQTKQNKKKGNNYIMVIIDHFTRWMELYALKRMEAIEVAEKSLEFTCRHGSLLKILSDQDLKLKTSTNKYDDV